MIYFLKVYREAAINRDLSQSRHIALKKRSRSALAESTLSADGMLSADSTLVDSTLIDSTLSALVAPSQL